MLKIKMYYNDAAVTRIRQTRTKQGFKSLSIVPFEAKVEFQMLFDLLQSHIDRILSKNHAILQAQSQIYLSLSV